MILLIPDVGWMYS